MADDSSDDDFSLSFSLPGASTGKDKAAAAKLAKKKAARSFHSSSSGLDALIAESKRDAVRSEKVRTILDLGDGILAKDLGRMDEQKARTDATEAKDKATHKAIMEDTSIKVAGVIRVFGRPQCQALPDLQFSAPSPAGELSVLFEAVKQSESDPEDLEDLLRNGLVPWVRKKIEGKAPPEVCRWLLGLVGRHEVPSVVAAAEAALLQLLAEDDKGWRLRYEDTVDIWRSCGAAWLAVADGDEEEEEEEEKEEEEEEEKEVHAHLQVHLWSALNIVESCFRRGAYEMSPDELGEMVQDLVAASLDRRVAGYCCQAAVGRALVAVVNALPAGQSEYARVLSSMVDGLCDPSARALKAQITPFTWALLAKNLPFERASSTRSSPNGSIVTVKRGRGVESAAEAADQNAVCTATAAVPSSLRHEVCHRLLSERFLSDTSYASTGESPEGLGRALVALRVLLDDEDDLLEDESSYGYDRQFVVLSLATEMAAGSMAVSKTGKPDGEESRRMILLLDGINKELRNVMQSSVQMSKTLLALTKSKYRPYLPVASARQSKLFSFGLVSSGAADNDDDDEEKDGEEDKENNAEFQ